MFEVAEVESWLLWMAVDLVGLDDEVSVNFTEHFELEVSLLAMPYEVCDVESAEEFLFDWYCFLCASAHREKASLQGESSELVQLPLLQVHLLLGVRQEQ